MESKETSPKLTSDLDHWEVRLKTGGVVKLRAHGASEEGDALVFVALMDGSPPFEYELARFPLAAVDEWQGGWLTPRA
jgi:hypothetical protein